MSRVATPPTRRLAGVATDAWALTPASISTAQWIVLDTLTVAAAALSLDASTQRALRSALSRAAGSGRCVAAGARDLPAPIAAAVTGCAAHGIDYDDTYLVDGVKAHLSAPVVATAFAVAQEQDASGARFLAAVVRGVEAAARLGHAATPELVRRWHPTAVLGVVGAAVAAAYLLDLGIDETEQAIGLAADRAAGTRACLDGTDATKPLHVGLAAADGILAARMVAAGVPGPGGFLEKPAGFAQTYLGGRWRPDELAGRDTPLILGTSTKFFPVMHAVHAAVQASLGIVAVPGPLDPADLRRVVVGQAHDHVGFGALWTVATPLAARLSLPYAVAVSLLDGACGLPQVAAERLVRADVQELMSRVEVIADDVVQHRYGTRIASTVRVELTDGRVIERTEADPLGTPARPVDDARRLAKATEVIDQAPTPAAGAALLAAVAGLPTAPDLGPLAAAFAALGALPQGPGGCVADREGH